MANVMTYTQFVNNNNNNNVVTNSTLPEKAHEEMDREIEGVARDRLVGIQDLISRGLTKPLKNMGTSLSMYQKMGNMRDATINMSGATSDQNDNVTYALESVPVPVFLKNWEIEKRLLLASQNDGSPLDLEQLNMATRIVFDGLENALFNGIPSLIVDGKTVYGYATHPDRNTVVLAGTGWTAATDRDVVGDTKNMLQAMYDAKRYGPFIMYVAKNIWAEVQLDYKNQSHKTFIDRIEMFKDITEVKCSDALEDGDIILVQMTKDTVDLAVAEDIANEQYATEPFIDKFVVYMVAVPRVKSDKNGSCAVVHASPAS